MIHWEVVGFIASILGSIQLIPEVLAAYKSKQLTDIAWGMLFLTTTSAALWLVYALQFQLWPVLISAVVNFIMGLSLVSLKVRYRGSARINVIASDN
ncbi:MAG: hypothetical protein HY817_02050 [Candidatus Abawacabacteria bacterium]|nr:hypothetical protein [Candidatus Abawacabacteria bacterium]